VVGLPSWGNSDGYDIAAKAEKDATFEQMRRMPQSLLAQQFKLALHREARESSVYEPVVAKSGLRIEANKDGGCITFNADARPSLPRPGQPLANICGAVRRQTVSPPPNQVDRIEAIGMSMPAMIELLSDEVARYVIDKTAFNGTFDLTLEFAPEQSFGVNSSAPAIFTALQEQLGLRLQPAKAPVEVLVIDHVERPDAN